MQARKQAGWTMWSLTFSLLIIGFIGWIGLKIVPFYIDNHTVSSVLKPLAQDRSLSEASYGEIEDLIAKRLNINNVRFIKKDDIEFIEEDNYTQIRIDYEERIKMVSNIDVVLSFKNHVNIQNN